jgi:acyl-coenzyme A synthetase/AMP-(fatty) acid ligase
VIGFPHDTKGEGICCYVTLKEGVEESPEVAAELRHQVGSGLRREGSALAACSSTAVAAAHSSGSGSRPSRR